MKKKLSLNLKDNYSFLLGNTQTERSFGVGEAITLAPSTVLPQAYAVSLALIVLVIWG